MSYLLLTLLLLPLVGSGLVFAWRNPASKYLALGLALIQMLLTFYMLSGFDYRPTVDGVLQYEINYPWSNYLKSNLHFGIDGMSLLMLLLTNILTPLIILSSFNELIFERTADSLYISLFIFNSFTHSFISVIWSSLSYIVKDLS